MFFFIFFFFFIKGFAGHPGQFRASHLARTNSNSVLRAVSEWASELWDQEEVERRFCLLSEPKLSASWPSPRSTGRGPGVGKPI